MDIKVLIATTSELKIQAVKEAFESCKASLEQVLNPHASHAYKYIHFSFEVCNSHSEVNEQPFGWEETMLGARNRIKNVVSDAPDFIIAIENGIIPIPHATQLKNKQLFLDVAWIEMASAHEGEFSAISTSVQMDPTWVEQAQSIGLDKTTAGQVGHDLYPDVSAKDPHTWLMGGVMTRVDLMRQAVQSCIGKYIATKKLKSKVSSSSTS